MNVQFYIPEEMLVGILCGIAFIIVGAIYVHTHSKKRPHTKRQNWQSWRPNEPDLKSWRPVEPESGIHWGKGIAGWTIGMAAVCMVGSKLSLWQQYREKEAQRIPPPQTWMVQPAPQTPPQTQTPMPEVVIPTPQPRQVAIPRTRSKPAAPAAEELPTPDQTILCWIDGNGKRIYSNTVPQGKGVKPCP